MGVGKISAQVAHAAVGTNKFFNNNDFLKY